MKETKALIQFQMQNKGKQVLCVENVFRIEQTDAYTNKIYYGVPGSSSSTCPTATINWNWSIAAYDMVGILWDAII